MRLFRFVKETNSSWYVVLPEYPGEKEDLQMVCGADTFLDLVSEGLSEVYLTISTQPFPNCSRLILSNVLDEGGATYILHDFRDIPFDLNMWLCDVVKFIYDSFPSTLFIDRID